MKKRIGALFLIVIFTAALLQGCSFGKTAKDKVRDLEFTVVQEEDVPEELKKIIDEKKTQAYELSYSAGDDLFITIGYGEQKTGGYSIAMEELYATDNAIVVSTNLIGPSKDEKVEELPSYPFIVIKTEYMDLTVEYAGIENNFFE